MTDCHLVTRGLTYLPRNKFLYTGSILAGGVLITMFTSRTTLVLQVVQKPHPAGGR